MLALLTSCASKVGKNTPRSVMLGSYQVGRGISAEDISETKADASINLAIRLTDRYNYIDKFTKDSIALELKKGDKLPLLIDVARKANAHDLIFMRVDRFHNIIRVDLQVVETNDTTKRRNGDGYAFLNFRDAQSESAVFDPSLLRATQRAFAVAVGDSNLYANLSGNLALRPAPTLVIGGISFAEVDNYVRWDLFDKKLVNSFSGVETIFLAASKSPNFVVYDNETRDSIYTLFKLYAVENYNLPTLVEIDVLRKFNIEYMIAGAISQSNSVALVSLSLFKITKDNITSIARVEENLLNDSIDEFNAILDLLTKRLLKLAGNR